VVSQVFHMLSFPFCSPPEGHQKDSKGEFAGETRQAAAGCCDLLANYQSTARGFRIHHLLVYLVKILTIVESWPIL
ncbi:MAG: hypothetical protein IJS37_03045, partial [Bacilli bacterium]|nr:hypothetical protein [Bacilli bacterium]